MPIDTLTFGRYSSPYLFPSWDEEFFMPSERQANLGGEGTADGVNGSAHLAGRGAGDEEDEVADAAGHA